MVSGEEIMDSLDPYDFGEMDWDSIPDYSTLVIPEQKIPLEESSPDNYAKLITTTPTDRVFGIGITPTDRAFGAGSTTSNRAVRNDTSITLFLPVVHSSNTPTNITPPIVVICSSKADERNKKAVQAKLENPELTPTEALRRGGFIISKNATGKTIIDGTSLRERKNYLYKQIRLLKPTSLPSTLDTPKPYTNHHPDSSTDILHDEEDDFVDKK